MEHSNTNEQEERAEQQAQTKRRYSVQMLAEKYPRMTSLYFFGFGIWTALDFILIPLATLRGRIEDIAFLFLSAGAVCFVALSILLSLLALWLKHSPAKRRAQNETTVPAAKEATAERAIQRFTARHPLIASAYLYGYGIFSAVFTVYALLRRRYGGSTPSICDIFLARTQYYSMLLSILVAILAFRCLRKA